MILELYIFLIYFSLVPPSTPIHHMSLPTFHFVHHFTSSSFHSRYLSGYQKATEPRTPRCGWDVRVRSPRDPAEVVLALREAAQGCGCQVHQAGPFLLSCTHGAAGSRVAFEAEVCQLPNGPTETSGVRFKRLWGAPLAFRDIAAKVSKELELWGRQGVEGRDKNIGQDDGISESSPAHTPAPSKPTKTGTHTLRTGHLLTQKPCWRNSFYRVCFTIDFTWYLSHVIFNTHFLSHGHSVHCHSFLTAAI